MATRVYLGLGSNLGDRRANLERALGLLQKIFEKNKIRVSTVYETPALLPLDALADWNHPFLNLALEGFWGDSAQTLLTKIKAIEAEFGPRNPARWSPRLLDIDLLLFGEEQIETESLKVPHPALTERAFVLDPLKDLNPELRIPGLQQKKTVRVLARAHRDHSPIWMGILNITPDSFSDGGLWLNQEKLEAELNLWDRELIGIIDVGAESTRPGAQVLSWSEEWERLLPIFQDLKSRYSSQFIRPLLSVDTYHVEVAERALEFGADIINDVSGLSDSKMLNLLKESSAQYVLMHSLSIPADPKKVLNESSDPVSELKTWFSKKLEQMEKAGVKSDRVILDPGIGFGKTSLQSLEILKRLNELQDFPARILIGHSRKSFMKLFTTFSPAERDAESIGVSLSLATRGIDILRVHNPVLHKRAHLAARHLG